MTASRALNVAPEPPDASAPQARAAIAGVGGCVPDSVLSTEAIEAKLGLDAGWIVRRTGIRSRHVASQGERLVDCATSAAVEALAGAGVAAGDLDLVLVATTTPDQILPNIAPLVATELGAWCAGAFDVGAACTGFISALAVGVGQIEAGRAQRVLVVGADFMSRVTDPSDRSTAGVFADGAGAAVLSPAGDGGGIGPICLGADGSGAELIRIETADALVRMNGPETFRAAVDRLSQVTLEVAGRADVGLEEVDLFVYHQANGRILAAVGERLGLSPERVVDCIAQYGNTSAATLPLALAHAEREDLVSAGDTLLLAAFGAGFTWGATIMRWGT